MKITPILTALALTIATTGAVSGAATARDLEQEFRTGISEFGRSLSEIQSDFRSGVNPTAPAKPDSFGTGVDLDSN